MPFMQEIVGVLHDTKPSGYVSPACRSLMSCNSPDWCLSVRGVVPKVQTASAKNAEDWAGSGEAVCVLGATASVVRVVRTQTRYCER